MSKKPDLIKIFKVEGLVEPKTLIDETLEDVNEKTPFNVTEDIKDIVDMLNGFVYEHDVEKAIKAVEALSIRVTSLAVTIYSVKEWMDRKGD
jgi:hypothetical protein